MPKIIIHGSKQPLHGEIAIGGAKNAALPLLAATLLSDKDLVLENVPNLLDVNSMFELLNQHGTTIERNQNITLNSSGVNNLVAPYEIVRTMRASILVLGPLLARHGYAKVSLPGGCVIGSRPVDLHIMGLKLLGAAIDIQDGYIIARAPKGLFGNTIDMPMISVTATENLMMAATLAKGTTIINNAALEPEIVNLGETLNKMGAKINGLGTSKLIIEGVDSLHAATSRVIADRIETGTYAVAAAITRGNVFLKNTSLDMLPTVCSKLNEIGVKLTAKDNGIWVQSGERITATDIMTNPYPGFATDLQAQLMALLCLAEGTSVVTETLFENRFMHVQELLRLGANIQVHGNTAKIQGVKSLKGAEVMASDLRASASLVIAGLVADGITTIHRSYHLDRGYEKLEEKLRNCGAIIERI